MITKLLIAAVMIGVLVFMCLDLFRECRKYHGMNHEDFWKKDLDL